MLKTSKKKLIRALLVLQWSFSVAEGLVPCRLSVSDRSTWLNEDGSLRFPTYIQDEGKVLSRTPEISDDMRSVCRLNETSNDVICRDSIDFKFIKKIRKWPVRTLTIDSYNGKETTKMRAEREWMISKSSMEKLTGEFHLQDISVKMTTTLDLQRISDEKYIIDGEAFSNRIIKIGWKYKGEIVLQVVENEKIAVVDIVSRDYENPWTLQGRIHLSLDKKDFHGNLTFIYDTQKAIHFDGFFTVNATGEGKAISGQLEAKDVKVAGDFLGRLSKYFSTEITIPRGAFSGMTIQNLIFKDSYFFGDFHCHSFEGISQLQAIRFDKSQMEFMPEYDSIFRGSTLKAIFIEDCSTSNIDVGHASNVPHLEFLSFKGSGFLEFSNKFFRWLSSSNLTYLNFHDTNFKLLGNEPILEPVADTLRYLDISYSTLKHEAILRQFIKGTKITHLSLAGLQLKKVPVTALEMVKDTLIYLSLRKNNFEKVPGENMLVPILDFPAMSELAELDLHDCRINYIEKRAFESLKNLKKLVLSRNNVVNLQDGWVNIKPKIIFLNLSYNGAATRASPINLLDLRDPFDLSDFDKLETLDLSNSDFWNSNRLIMNANLNLRHLSLCRCGLKSLNDSTFEAMPNLQEMDLSGNPELGKNFSLQKLQNIKFLKVLHLTNNGIVNLTFDVPENAMNHLTHLDLSNNDVMAIRPEFFSFMPKLMVLKLSRNSISYWPTNFHNFSASLKKIFLDNNRIEKLKLDTIVGLSTLDEFSLGGNPFKCGSFILDFQKRLRKRNGEYYLCPESMKQVELRNEEYDVTATNNSLLWNISAATTRKLYLYRGGCALIKDWSESDYLCYSITKRKFVQFWIINENFLECQDEIDLVSFNWSYIMVTFTLMFCFFVGFLWWKWWNLRLFTKLLKNAAILSFMDKNDSERTAYEYDAFVSYTDKDRQWVTEKLIPNLEKLDDVKICLHERDFQVGLSILENIVSSIDKSKCVILVLSQAFVKSQWCQYEMHLAYHRLLETRRDQMILILLEDIPPSKRPRTLNYLMMTKTYIQWPGNTTNTKVMELFWHRLFKALMYINRI